MSDGYITGSELVALLTDRLTPQQREALRLATEIDLESMARPPDIRTRRGLPLDPEEVALLRDRATIAAVRQILAAKIGLAQDVEAEYRHALDVLSDAMGARLTDELDAWLQR